MAHISVVGSIFAVEHNAWWIERTAQRSPENPVEKARDNHSSPRSDGVCEARLRAYRSIHSQRPVIGPTLDPLEHFRNSIDWLQREPGSPASAPLHPAPDPRTAAAIADPLQRARSSKQHPERREKSKQTGFLERGVVHHVIGISRREDGGDGGRRATEQLARDQGGAQHRTSADQALGDQHRKERLLPEHQRREEYRVERHAKRGRMRTVEREAVAGCDVLSEWKVERVPVLQRVDRPELDVAVDSGVSFTSPRDRSRSARRPQPPLVGVQSERCAPGGA